MENLQEIMGIIIIIIGGVNWLRICILRAAI